MSTRPPLRREDRKMENRLLAQQLVVELGKTLTVPDLALDESHSHCVLVFGDDLVVDMAFEEESGRLMLSCWLDELPAGNSGPLLRELLGANLYWHRTQGAVLAMEESSNGVILTYGVHVVETSAAEFEELLHAFVDMAEHWRARVRSTATAVPPAQIDVPRPPGSGSYA
ncbi:MAG: CesT family type III secretion system chaperone [Burkholderiales bacterium]|nr:MAG: CesT family type III secretion system chaperone [Burkholderiales bacterium]